MANCVRKGCGKPAVINVTAAYCKSHFIKHFESKVAATIKRYELISREDKVAVACSGGKDSTAVLYILNKFGYGVTALAVDEGIRGYRNNTLEDLRNFCSRNSIPLKVVSFRSEFGFTLDKAVEKVKVLPCNVCGTLRRHLLNSAAKGFDRIVTGHNLDDEAQSVMMNLFRNNLSLAARLGPVTGVVKDKKFVPRVKPLYFCYEKEAAAYAFLQGFGIRFNECPHSTASFRASVRDFLNGLEQEQPGTKQNIVCSFLSILPRLKREYSAAARISYCASCGEPSSKELCKACNYVNSLGGKVVARQA